MNAQLQKEIAQAERRGEFDLAETLKGFDFIELPKKSAVCKKCAKAEKALHYQKMVNRTRQQFTRLVSAL